MGKKDKKVLPLAPYANETGAEDDFLPPFLRLRNHSSSMSSIGSLSVFSDYDNELCEVSRTSSLSVSHAPFQAEKPPMFSSRSSLNFKSAKKDFLLGTTTGGLNRCPFDSDSEGSPMRSLPKVSGASCLQEGEDDEEDNEEDENSPTRAPSRMSRLSRVSPAGSPTGSLTGSPKRKNRLSLVRNKVLRTQSMINSPSDLYHKSCKSYDNSLMAKCGLRTETGSQDVLPRIKIDEFVRILDGLYRDTFEEIVIVDCRFEYEYNGGHVNRAINIISKKQLEDYFFTSPSTKKVLMIFHCEFSSYRGPIMANHLRQCDRLINQDNYPFLNYPDIVVLDGGYKSFFQNHADRCFPKSYITMKDTNFSLTCEKELHRIRSEDKGTLQRCKSTNMITKKRLKRTVTSLSGFTPHENAHPEFDFEFKFPLSKQGMPPSSLS
ncbi:hypothetical protein LJB42_000184 [Komagataella kurtzmanii]|nr:hypothetical protein LJB42_000184 [Komagataella kurtzmanii]